MYTRINSPFAWILTFFLLLFLYTKFLGPIPFSVNSVTTQKSTTFDVVGEGKVSVKPDVATITVGIEANGATVSSAQEQINSVINKVSQSVKGLGIDEKDIQTTNYNINPDYDFTGGTQRIKGYLASTNLFIKVRETDKANQVIDVATQNGANQVGGINFDVDDKTKAQNEARQKAVEDAKKKAEDAAKIAGFRLGRVVNYSENMGGYPEVMPLARSLDVKAGGANPTQVEPGSTDITVQVTLSFDIL